VINECEIRNGLVAGGLASGNVELLLSPNCSPREEQDIGLIVIHNISLPPGQYGGKYVQDFFLNKLKQDEHEYFTEICELQVSAHLLIERCGSVTQFVSLRDKAWHAGVSSFRGRDNCNEFSIGIELEGTDQDAYTEKQYQVLVELVLLMQRHYPLIKDDCIVGHSDIAPGRKTDPGESFDWDFFHHMLATVKKTETERMQ